MARQQYQTGTPWEPRLGYSRAVRVGQVVHVSGTTATNDQGVIIAREDPYGQAVQTLKNIQAALQALGADLKHVVRTRVYVTNMDQWEEVARAHFEFFGTVRPTCSLLGVNALVVPEMLVEIEVEAIIAE